MDAHTRLILQALHTLLRAAIACAPSDSLYRVYNQAALMTERALLERPDSAAAIVRSHAGASQSGR